MVIKGNIKDTASNEQIQNEIIMPLKQQAINHQLTPTKQPQSQVISRLELFHSLALPDITTFSLARAVQQHYCNEEPEETHLLHKQAQRTV